MMNDEWKRSRFRLRAANWRLLHHSEFIIHHSLFVLCDSVAFLLMLFFKTRKNPSSRNPRTKPYVKLVLASETSPTHTAISRDLLRVTVSRIRAPCWIPT